MTSITKIEAHHIKGIEHAEIKCEIVANKPNFLVAPNGTGKSSLAIGFKSLNTRRLKLGKTNNYARSKDPEPFLELTLDKEGPYRADSNKNEIGKHFSIAVINSGIHAKQSIRKYGGRSYSIANIGIDDRVIEHIPPNDTLKYSIANIRKQYPKGLSSLLFNLKQHFKNPLFCNALIEEGSCFTNTTGELYAKRINSYFDQLLEKGKREDIVSATIDYSEIEKVIPLAKLKNVIKPFFPNESEALLYLNAIQINRYCCENEDTFKKHAAHLSFEARRKDLDEMISCINTTSKKIKTIRKKDVLTLHYPNREDVSNGELDILNFLIELHCAKRELKKEKCLLIIDEVFDYLDDGNLIIAQHFILKTIDAFKKEGREIYPVILTHMDPDLMKSYQFKTKHVSYFGKADSSSTSSQMCKLLQDRSNCQKNRPKIYDAISHHYLHYSNVDYADKETISYIKSQCSTQKSVTSDAFAKKMEEGFTLYLNNEAYDATKVCCALRRRVEKYAYDSIKNEENKNEYMQVDKGTKYRFAKAEEFGVDIPEIMYLLSSLYNSCMHLNNPKAELPLIYRKLDNGFIKNMIKEVAEMTN